MRCRAAAGGGRARLGGLGELPAALLGLPGLEGGAEVEVAAEDVELDAEEEVEEADGPGGGEGAGEACAGAGREEVWGPGVGAGGGGEGGCPGTARRGGGGGAAALRIFSCSQTAYFSCGESAADPSFARFRVSVRLVTLSSANIFAFRPAGAAEGDGVAVRLAGGDAPARSCSQLAWKLARERRVVCDSLDAVKVLRDPAVRGPITSGNQDNQIQEARCNAARTVAAARSEKLLTRLSSREHVLPAPLVSTQAPPKGLGGMLRLRLRGGSLKEPALGLRFLVFLLLLLLRLQSLRVREYLQRGKKPHGRATSVGIRCRGVLPTPQQPPAGAPAQPRGGLHRGANRRTSRRTWSPRSRPPPPLRPR